ncbi:MAG: doxx family protein [Flavobacteriales bacterium]|nr:doxx family protein [Flavobacteriales bacterium]
MKLVKILMFSFGVVYLWFGILKFFPGISPAEVLAGETIRMLTFNIIGATLGVKLLALLETVIGLACIVGFAPKFTIRLIIAHMICTFAPLFLMPDAVFGPEIFQLTLVGQYILKNLVFVSALLVVYNIVSKREDEMAKLVIGATDFAKNTSRSNPSEALALVKKNNLKDQDAA